MRREDYLKHPLEHVDLLKADGHIARLLESFANSSYQSRNLNWCYEVFLKMLADPGAVIFLGLSGALIPGGMKKVIQDMIRYRLVDVIVSTGANLYHDFYEGFGHKHYKGDHHADDAELCNYGIDRIYDTYADDNIFADLDRKIADFTETLEPREYSSREFLQRIGALVKAENSVLGTIVREGTPVYVPALADSSFGIALTEYFKRVYERKNKEMVTINHIRDNYEMTQIKQGSENSGGIYLGGGVPKNYIQQLEPLADVMKASSALWKGKTPGKKVPGHKYGIQITTDDPKWGGLSGCTLSESLSWGKYTDDAYMATVYMDITIGLPILVAAAMSHKDLIKKRKKRTFTWNGNKLVSLTME